MIEKLNTTLGTGAEKKNGIMSRVKLNMVNLFKIRGKKKPKALPRHDIKQKVQLLLDNGDIDKAMEFIQQLPEGEGTAIMESLVSNFQQNKESPVSSEQKDAIDQSTISHIYSQLFSIKNFGGDQLNYIAQSLDYAGRDETVIPKAENNIQEFENSHKQILEMFDRIKNSLSKKDRRLLEDIYAKEDRQLMAIKTRISMLKE